MKIDIQIIFLVIGLVQGVVIMSIGILKWNSISTRFFTAIIFVFCLLIFNNLSLFFSFQSGNNSILDFIIWEPVLLLGPLTYFYGKSLFEKGFQFTKHKLLHFIPSLLDFFPVIFSLVVWTLASIQLGWGMDERSIYLFLNSYDDYIVIPQFISLTLYLIISWKYLYRIKLVSDYKTYSWFRDYLRGLSVINGIWFPFLVLYVSPYQGVLLNTVYFHPVFYPICIFIYFLSYKILKTGMSFRPNQISSDELDEKVKHLNDVMTSERLYKNADLNLRMLSQQANIPESILSFIFKHCLKKGFNQYINEYRVKEAITKMTNGDAHRLSVEGIGIEVGFSSRATFYRAFKQATGKHPSELLKK